MESFGICRPALRGDLSPPLGKPATNKVRMGPRVYRLRRLAVGEEPDETGVSSAIADFNPAVRAASSISG